MTLKEEIAALKRIADFHKEKPPQGPLDGWATHPFPFQDARGATEQRLNYHSSYTTSSTWATITNNIAIQNIPAQPKKGLYYARQLVVCFYCGATTEAQIGKNGVMYLEDHWLAPNLTFDEPFDEPYTVVSCEAGGKRYGVHPCQCFICGQESWATDGRIILNPHNCQVGTRCYCDIRNPPLPR